MVFHLSNFNFLITKYAFFFFFPLFPISNRASQWREAAPLRFAFLFINPITYLMFTWSYIIMQRWQSMAQPSQDDALVVADKTSLLQEDHDIDQLPENLTFSLLSRESVQKTHSTSSYWQCLCRRASAYSSGRAQRTHNPRHHYAPASSPQGPISPLDPHPKQASPVADSSCLPHTRA